MDERAATGGSFRTVEIFAFEDPALTGLDLTGFSVEAVDGGIGRIDKSSNEVGDAYVVVDTGPWIFGKKVIVPAGIIQRVDLDEETVYVGRTTDEIRSAPPWDESTEPGKLYRTELGDYYAGREPMGPAQA